jgi:alanyl-tRNA synthetase
MANDSIISTPAELDEATQHSAQHLLSATILRRLGYPTVSMRIGEAYTTIDVDAPDLTAADLAAVEQAVFDAIEADEPIRTHHCPPERIEDFPLRKRPPADAPIIRIVEIAGHDFSPCSGKHLDSTALILALKIIGAERYKGMVRLSFVAGRRAFADYRMVRAQAEAAAGSLRTSVDRLESAAAALVEQKAQADRYLLIARESLAAADAARLVARGGAAVAESYGDRPFDEALRVARAAQKLGAAVVAVASTVDLKAAVLSADRALDLRPLLKPLLDRYAGKGGGGPDQYQAAFTARSGLDGFMADVISAFAGKTK